MEDTASSFGADEGRATDGEAAEAGRDVAGVIAPPPLVYAGAFGAGLLLDRLAALSPMRVPGGRLLGAAFLVGGLGITGWGFATMRSAGTPVIPTEPTTRIVTEGPFQHTRNPGYLGMALAYLGLALSLRRVGPVLLLPAALAVMQRGVIEREERYLARRFGAAYESYRAATPRWF